MTYEIFAIRYGTQQDRSAASNFIFPDDHAAVMPIDYYLWAIVGGGANYRGRYGVQPRHGGAAGAQADAHAGGGAGAGGGWTRRR